MGTQDSPSIENASAEALETRIREAARRLSAEPVVGDLETWYLARVVEHCSRAISDVYRTVNLDQILSGDAMKPEGLEDLQSAISGHPATPLRRVARAPDELRGIGDRCLYDVGMAGVRDYHGLSLETLGTCSYRMAADVLSILADERELRELFRRNLVRTLPIEEEICFLRQCADRFRLYAFLLSSLRGEPLSPAAVVLRGGRGDRAGLSGREPHPASVSPSGTLSALPSAAEGERERLLARCERALLLAGTDMERLRQELRERVLGQSEAVETICDDLLLESTGARGEGAPLFHYLLVGPAGVGKTHLLRSLAAILESHWRIEVPLLIIEGSRCTSPFDMRRLAGESSASTEEGSLGEFLRRAPRAPLSVLIFRDMDQAHPLLYEWLDPLLATRGRGRGLSLPGPVLEGTLLAFTTNSGGPSRELLLGGGGAEEFPEGGPRGQGIPKDRPACLLYPGCGTEPRTIRFSPLSLQAMERILDLELAPVIRRFRTRHGLEIVLTPPARRRLLAIGFSPDQGAGCLAEVVQRHGTLEISRKVKRDESRQDAGREEAIRRLREIREGILPVNPAAVAESLLLPARARLPYRRIVIDESGGEFTYRGEN